MAFESPRACKLKASKASRKSSSLPSSTVEYLKNWMMSPEHIAHPYPTEQEKAQIMMDTGIEMKQLTNWFVNNRKRYWKPRVEARLQQQAQAAVAAVNPSSAASVESSVKANFTPITPDTVKPENNIASTSLVHFDFPRTASHASLVGTDISKALARKESISSLHQISEASSNASVSASEGCDASVDAHDDYAMESLVKTMEESSDCTSSDGVSQASSEAFAPSLPHKKRSSLIFGNQNSVIDTPRKKFRRVSLETWRSSCEEASDVYCASLPTLEEAAALFGYSN